MTRYTQDWFDALADTGERAVAGVLMTLANRQDLEGLSAFMALTAKPDQRFPHLHEMTPLQTQCLKANGESDQISTSFVHALTTAFNVGKSVNATWEASALPDGHVEYARNMLRWAQGHPKNDHDALMLVSNYLVTNVADPRVFQATEQAWKETTSALPAAELVTRAAEGSNLVAAKHFMGQLAKADMQAFAKEAAHDEPDHVMITSRLAGMLQNHPPARAHVLAFIDAVEAEVGTDLGAAIRLQTIGSIIGKAGNSIFGADGFFSMLKQLHGDEPEQFASQQKWLISANAEDQTMSKSTSDYIARAIVEHNCVELLPLVAPLLVADKNPRVASIGLALAGGFEFVHGPEGARRLRETIECLQARGHKLDDVALEKEHDKVPDLHAMHHLAQSTKAGNCAAPLEKLVVLLELGCDPKVKDSRNKMPHQVLDDDFKPAWHHTLNAYKARNVAHDVLAELSASAAP